jgi:hypothetical protein
MYKHRHAYTHTHKHTHTHTHTHKHTQTHTGGGGNTVGGSGGSSVGGGAGVVMELTQKLLVMVRRREWDLRFGGYLGLKYVMAVKQGMVTHAHTPLFCMNAHTTARRSEYATTHTHTHTHTHTQM